MDLVAVALVIGLEIGAPVALVLWLLRGEPGDSPKDIRQRQIRRQELRRIVRQARVECADLDREYARLVRQHGRR